MRWPLPARWLLPFVGFGLASSVAFGGEVCRGTRADREIGRQVDAWGPAFGAPRQTLLAIAEAESDMRPDCRNTSRRNAHAGGAWGPFQMTVTTASDIAGKLSRSKCAKVAAVAQRWEGRGEVLQIDLELATVLAADLVGRLVREFGAFEVVAAAYHQGIGATRRRLAAGLPLRGPRGRIYVARALDAWGAS